jgi:hypothetical protein
LHVLNGDNRAMNHVKTLEQQVDGIMQEKIVFMRFCVLCGKQDLRQPKNPGKTRKGRWVCSECMGILAE